MLTRAAKRHAQHHLLCHLAAATREQLALPWLSLSTSNALDFRRRLSSDPHPKPSQRHRDAVRDPSPGRGPPKAVTSRNLTTEALSTASPDPFYADQYIPFEGSPVRPRHLPQTLPPPEWGYTGLKPDISSSLVILPDEPARAAPQVRKSRSGMTGDATILHESLYALVKVERYAQAERVVRRLAEIYKEDSPELLDAHRQYLTGRLDSLLAEPRVETFAKMQRYFELDIRGRKCAPDSSVLAIMIKAAFAVLEGSRLDRTIRRYLGIAEQQGSDVRDTTMASALFFKSEWLSMLRLQPQDFTNPNQILSEEEIEDQMEAIAGRKPSSLPTSEVAPEELRPAEQKGLGLKALKMALKSFSPTENISTSTDRDSTADYTRQERLERDVLGSALERWREESESNQAMRTKGQLSDSMLGSHAYDWIQEMKLLVKAEMREAEAADETTDKSVPKPQLDKRVLSPFIRLANAEKLCAATVLEYVNYAFDPRDATSNDRPLAMMVNKIGVAVWSEIAAAAAQRSMLEKIHSLPSKARLTRTNQLLREQKLHPAQPAARYLEDEAHEDQEPAKLSSNKTIEMKLGAYFLSIFIRVAKLPVSRRDPVTGKMVTQDQPVAIHSMRWRVGKKVGVLVTNQELIDRLKREPVGSFIAKHLPMIVEPRPWKSLRDGGYIHTRLNAVRFRDSSRSQLKYVEMATKRGDMKQTYAGLDVIGKVPWRINRPLFNVLAQAWNSGEPIGGLAPENPPEVWPEKPADGDLAALRRWKSLVRTAQNERTGFHSQRCYQNFQLEVARAYLNDTFYCPHSVDFRGRAYPIPPYFNHMGADYVRGLFLFAQGRELGDVGMKWLKIHLANVYGFDKASLADREQFAMEHIADIYDSASNPLGGKRWWLTAEDPWQCLAACMELRNALDSPQPTKYVSHLPVQQDGTCNGLQHYAALGGDVIGARQVNLMPGDRPADIYSAVADLVKQDVSDAAARGDPQAVILDGHITRKVVKQPVMTNVYGVTYHGAKAQVKKQLADVLPKASLDNEIHHHKLAAYVATLIFKALSRMFTGATAIQTWLGECGSRISQSLTPQQIERIKQRRAGTLEDATKSKLKRQAINVKDTSKEDYQFKSTIVWTTPLGMPVVQPYRSPKYQTIRTSLQGVLVLDSTSSDPVSRRKQLQGFPPNFIHSLDATHMMLSALKCDEIGLQFSSVHDSFWTHAADVPIMNRVLRDAFVRVHTENVVGRLREEFIARYKGCMTYTAIDQRSSLAKKIVALRKAKGVHDKSFSFGVVKAGVQIDELLEEYERARLLASTDPEEQERGREMITPASLFEAEPDAAKVIVKVAEERVTLLGDGVEGHEEPDADLSADVPGVQRAREADHIQDAETAAIDDVNAVQPETAGADDASAGTEVEAPPVAKPRRPALRSKQLYLWMPISFPPPPERGDFDVASLKDSQYFFS